MKENKNKEIMNYILENYNVQSADDVAEALKDMFKDTIQGMMNAEFDSSMGYEKSDNKIIKSNYRNGASKKNVKSKFGEFELEVPRDRNNEFEPMIVPKHQRNISGIEDKIINLYARGLSTREISEEIEDIYGIEMSHTMVRNITDTIMPKIKEWQYRPLQSVYPTSLRVWEDNWDAICTLFNYSKELRHIMYTTNAIESLNRTYRKYTKTKGVFPNDDGLLKSLYLATMNVQKKRTTRYKNWDIIYNELSILYPGRI